MPIVILRSIFIVVIIVWYSSTVLRFINDYFRKEFGTYIEKDLKNDRFYKKSKQSESGDVVVVVDGEQQLSKIDLNLNTFVINKNEDNNQKYTNNDDNKKNIEFKNVLTKPSNQKENYKETLPQLDEKLQNWLENMQYTTTDIENKLLKINEKSIQKTDHDDDDDHDDDSKMKTFTKEYNNLNDKCIQNNIEMANDENYEQINYCHLPVNKHDNNNKHSNEIKDDL